MGWLPGWGCESKQGPTALLTEIPRLGRSNRPRIDDRRSRAKRVRVDPHDRYHEAKRLLGDGTVESQAELAGLLRVTRARVSQLMALDRLHPEVWTWLQEDGAAYRDVVSENLLREIARKPPAHQLAALRAWCRWLRR